MWLERQAGASFWGVTRQTKNCEQPLSFRRGEAKRLGWEHIQSEGLHVSWPPRTSHQPQYMLRN